jgi:hypothetical protein
MMAMLCGGTPMFMRDADDERERAAGHARGADPSEDAHEGDHDLLREREVDAEDLREKSTVTPRRARCRFGLRLRPL